MSYESAPGTEMLATHCACCGRPLLDAKSVECGVGPECRAVGVPVKTFVSSLATVTLTRSGRAVLVAAMVEAMRRGDDPDAVEYPAHVALEDMGMGWADRCREIGAMLREARETVEVEARREEDYA